MKVRRRAREVALQTLYEVDLAGHDPEEVLTQRLADEPLPPEGEEYARLLVQRVLENRGRLDTIIQRIAPEWPPDQLAVIDRSILRLAILEMQMKDEVPLKVAINEAVELAKTFGSEGSRRFINGALGALADHPEYSAALSEVKA